MGRVRAQLPTYHCIGAGNRSHADLTGESQAAQVECGARWAKWHEYCNRLPLRNQPEAKPIATELPAADEFRQPSQPHSTSVRDLSGYGGNPPEIVWPNGARVAVSVVVNFEEGAEQQVGDGDPTSEKVGEILSVVEPGTRDQGQEQLFAYGLRVGLWRFLDSLNQSETPATFFFCGQAVSRSPELAKAVTAAGHESACHGWRWRPHADYATQSSERDDLAKSVRAIEHVTGQRPVGFFCRGSESQWTRGLLQEFGMHYTSNAFDDDLPYYDRDNGLIVVPYNLDTNDMKFFHPNGFVRAQDMIDYVNDALDQLLIEARHGKSSTLSIGYHLRICGRPARFRAFTEIMNRLSSLRNDVWCARRIDIARHFGSVVARPA